jgi:hypothetical protein
MSAFYSVASGLDIFPKGWVSELLILRFRAGIRPPHHPPDYFITGLEPSLLGNSVIFQVSARQLSIFFTETQGKSSEPESTTHHPALANRHILVRVSNSETHPLGKMSNPASEPAGRL